MTAELTQEEIVTNLLSSNEILIRNKNNFYITSPSNLSEYLENIPKEVKECAYRTPDSKYTFIKDGGWKF